MNPRRINGEALEILALRWARSQTRRILNNVNVDCYIAGFKAAHDELYHKFGDFLIAEGKYYQEKYVPKRKETLAYSGIPFSQEHIDEFKNAKQFGEDLVRLGKMYKEMKLLPS